MSTKCRHAVSLSAVSLGLGSSLMVFGASQALADQVVKIGHVAPLTGGIAHLGKDNENGARLAIEEINKKGLTIGGQKITLELDAQDDAADPRQ
ncbi:ABC transporter substrate-binding protein, partial [Burkholderia sp. L27(2015)]|uniref:ABC transporter substrate-binding protein n=1 Tax=Burkholderia sp. L27(2015) TaxID=1641858 RepID=UPI00131C1A3C